MRELPQLTDLHPRNLTRRQRLLLVYVIGLVSVVLVFTVLYYQGMRTLEDKSRTVFQAFNTVIETMTTTGYGADSPWSTGSMNLFVAMMQVTGVVIGFITLRVLVIPLFERTPLNLDDRLSIKNDHVVVAEYQRDTEVLLDELEALDVDYVVVESDEQEAKRLSDDGYQAIDGDPEERSDLDRASIEKASLLITDAGEDTVSIVLTALEANESLRVVSFTASTRRQSALAEIGVDWSVAPHALIGRRLAEKVTTPIAIDASTDETSVRIREILIRRNSSLHGVQIRDSPFASDSNLTVVAGWFDGELLLPVPPESRLTPNTVLVVAGTKRAITKATSEVSGVRTSRVSDPSRVVIAGLGEGGIAAAEALPEEIDVTTIDTSRGAASDIVGDVTEPETLSSASIEDASALVVTVDDDATALLTIAMARSLAPDVEILVRVTDTEKASPAFRAGADYVLSIQRVCARLVATEVHGERVMDPVNQIRLIRTGAEPFVGDSLLTARPASKSGWIVVGLDRDGTIHTDTATVVEPGDEVFIAGSDDGIQNFERTVDKS